ncbi:phosphatase PAP2 family protein [Neolewinella persica]|uniref:phosphatase PAP2 family protein n=1 Tax=Neolewinella persica TaxID=70998 RepID=UPI00036517F0|nr:phosphatase PAP2 family protein [Neolewinella persica]
MTRSDLFLFITLVLSFGINGLHAQHSGQYNYDPAVDKVYAVKPWLEGGMSLAGIAATTYMFQRINDKDDFSIMGLDRSDVPGFDRWALPDNSSKSDQAKKDSDLLFYPSMALPFTLFFNNDIRKDWVDVTIMYLEAQAINGLIFTTSPLGPNFNDRKRPQAYLADLDDDTRGDGGNLNSFFSGHVSTTATGTFFFAKVLSDYNPQWNGKQRALAFGLASLPPIYVGVQRVRGLRHFPSDVALGFGLGAFIGVMTPEIHKRWQRNHRSSLTISGGYGDGAGGVGVSLVF